VIFSSITFLYLFLPITLLVYFAVPKKFRNAVLLVASMYFYFCGEPVYTLLLVFSSISDWLHSLYIEKHRGEKSAKIALVSSIVINLALLGFFKYIDFIIGIINLIPGVALPLLNVPLPIGISFYTFQTMSATIDVYRGNAKAERNIVSFATFVCLFPQLVAGPIVRYADLAEELNERTISTERIVYGIRRFCVGLAKKVLLANRFGELCSIFRASDDKSVLFYWLYAVAFTLQIYFDFSGYSDMAIGLGSVFGFTFPENFNYPYISRSITEFWRRWHMTLGSYFRDYVYIPLGGNRTTKVKWLRNILVVWFLTGLWHGAAWNFIIWGLMFGVLLLLEKTLYGKYLEKLPVLPHIYVMLIVTISFVIFNAASIGEMVSDLGGLIGLSADGALPLVSGEAVYYLRSYAGVIILGIIGSTPLVKKCAIRLNAALPKVTAVIEPIVTALFMLIPTAYLVDGSFNPFLYFRF